VSAAHIGASFSGAVTLDQVRTRLPGAPEALLGALTLRPAWDEGAALDFEARDLTLPGAGLTVAALRGRFVPDEVSAPDRGGRLQLDFTGLSGPDVSLAEGRLTARLDGPGTALHDLVFSGTGLVLAAARDALRLDLAVADLDLAAEALTPRALTPLRLVAEGVTGDVFQDGLPLPLAGVENGQLVAQTGAVALEGPEVTVPLNLTGDARSPAPLTGQVTARLVLGLDQPAECPPGAPVLCTRGLAALAGDTAWQVQLQNSDAAGGVACADMACRRPDFAPLSVSDPQVFVTDLAATQVLNPLLLAALIPELAKAAQ